MSPVQEGSERAETPGRGGVKGQIEARMRDVGSFIREQRRIARLSVRKLSEMAGVSNPYLSQIERGLRHPSAEILRDIAKALRISAETLYVRAGILENREEDDDLARHILHATTLSERQKEALLQIYESFQSDNRPRDSRRER
jgi:transcriptional regulator with XRE-family HTH domain